LRNQSESTKEEGRSKKEGTWREWKRMGVGEERKEKEEA